MTVLCQTSYLTASPGALSSGGCGWASPIVPGGRSLLICRVSTRWIAAGKAAIIATATIIAKISKVVRVRRRLLRLRLLCMDNTPRGLNQRKCGEPVPQGFARLRLAGTKSAPGQSLCCHGVEFSRRLASAANIYLPPSAPAQAGSHNHHTYIVVPVGIRHAYPKKGEVPEVVTVVEASTRHSAEACSAGHGSKPSCTKSATKSPTRGQTSWKAVPPP